MRKNFYDNYNVSVMLNLESTYLCSLPHPAVYIISIFQFVIEVSLSGGYLEWHTDIIQIPIWFYLCLSKHFLSNWFYSILIFIIQIGFNRLLTTNGTIRRVGNANTYKLHPNVIFTVVVYELLLTILIYFIKQK